MSIQDQYRVIGNPISHSKSPLIHRLFAEQTEQPLEYRAECVALGGFDAFIDHFLAQGGCGMNVTVPFKQDAYHWLTQHGTLDPLAERAGAVNTLAFENGNAFGYNTDGLGLVCDLTVNHKVALSGQRVLILGAGGAVRGVLEPLLKQADIHITIANRTAEKAHELAQHFSVLKDGVGGITGCGLDDLNENTPAFDVIINGTSTGLTGQMPTLPAHILKTGGVTYDMMYATEPTVFVKWGLEHGARLALDGCGMLVEQAAEAFLIWRGIRPDTKEAVLALTSHPNGYT